MPKNSNSELSNAQVSAAVAPFGVQLSLDQISKVKEYIRLLLKWNRLMSLTTVTDPLEIVGRHFGESMFAAARFPVENCRLADVGSGAGFPGLAIKILRPDVHVTLIESSKKKCAFLSEVTRALELTGVEVLPMRFEEIRPKEEFANFITARAVGGFSDILRWSRTALSRRGHLGLWVGGEDITSISNAVGWIWSPPERIPESQRRYILIGQYIGEGESEGRDG